MNFKYPMLLDGGTGSELIKLGMPGGVSSEKWTAENPQSIITVQGNYIKSGADAVLAPTFHCNRHCLADYSAEAETDELNVTLVKLSHQATAGTNTLVFGDLSPAAILLKPLGEYEFEYVYDVYSQQVRAIEKIGVDAYFVETAMTIAELRAIALAVRDNSEKPLLTTLTVTLSGKTQMSGTDALAGLITMQSMGVDAFGLNCSVGPNEMLAQIKRLAPYASVPLIAKPNAGMPKVIDGKAIYDCPPEEFAKATRALAENGVRFFGGCCGTDPTHIAALRKELDTIDFNSMTEIEKKHPEIMLSTETTAVFYDKIPEIMTVACTEDMADDAEDFEGIVKIAVNTPEELEIFRDNAGTITTGVCVTSDSEELFEKALMLYQGRACYDGSGNLSAEFIEKMSKRYGLFVL